MDVYTLILAIALGASIGCFLTVTSYRVRRDRAEASERARALEEETRLMWVALAANRIG